MIDLQHLARTFWVERNWLAGACLLGLLERGRRSVHAMYDTNLNESMGTITRPPYVFYSSLAHSERKRDGDFDSISIDSAYRREIM